MTSAADIKRLLAASHRLDTGRGVFVSASDRPFAYSDGAAAEAYLAKVVRDARDIAVGSGELASHIRDWPSLYHLGPARQNLLRPIASSLGGLVLEIGAGCGAITRLLGESGATVLAVEGSLTRAAIAASRCRDLPNVVVVCDNFENLALPLRFDLVTLIGVLEYSRMFLAGDDPVQAMLAKAGACLAEDGLLAVAIENQLGLKYLAGAREDHTGVAYYGVTGQYGARTAATFGEKELRARVAQAGFPAVQFLYPFPDYKLPSVLVSEKGFEDPAFNVVDLVATSMGRHHPHEGPYAYSESLARGVFVRNGLGAATANSFLLLAGRSEAARKRFPDASVLAFAYSTGRERCYAKETRSVSAAGETKVLRRSLYKVAAPKAAPVRQVLADEEYVRGEVLYRELERIVGRRGWSVADIAAWMRPLAELLRDKATTGTQPGDEACLASSLFDCTPFNVIRRESDGALVPFDLEWQPTGHGQLGIPRMVFRGLWNSLARVDDVAAPALSTPTDVASLTLATMVELGLAVTNAQALDWIRNEYEISNAVSGRSEQIPALVPKFHLVAVGDHDSAALPRVASGLGAAAHLPGPSTAFRMQAYFRAADEDYSEERSVSVPIGGEGDRIIANLPLPAREKGYATIRLDPLDVPGLVRLDRVAIVNASSEIVWETRRCRAPDFAQVHGFLDLSRIVGSASGTVWFAEGADPHVDLMISADALASLAAGGAIMVEMNRLDAAELSAIVRLATLAGGATPVAPGNSRK